MTTSIILQAEAGSREATFYFDDDAEIFDPFNIKFHLVAANDLKNSKPEHGT